MGSLVMIVEDSPTTRKILEVILRRAGIHYESYADGLAALGALQQPGHPVPDVLLLDIGLPKIDGYTIARLVKSQPRFNATAIIMLTAYDGVLDHIKGRLAGATAYLTKPLRSQEVLAVITAHLPHAV